MVLLSASSWFCSLLLLVYVRVPSVSCKVEVDDEEKLLLTPPGLLRALYVRRHRLSCRTIIPAQSTICMPDVGWLTARLLSVPDEGPSGGGEDKEIREYILKYRSPGGHFENEHPKIKRKYRLSNSNSTSTLRQRDLARAYRRLGPPIISLVLLYHLRRFYAVIHIIHQTCAQA